MPRNALVALIALLAALDAVIRIDPFGWHGLFTAASPLTAVESGMWLLLFAAAVYATPALRSGLSPIVAGTFLIAVAELARLGLAIWENATFSLATEAEIDAFQPIESIAAVAIPTAVAVGVAFFAWGLWRESDAPEPSTATRWVLIGSAAVAGAIDAAMLVVEVSRIALPASQVLPARLSFALTAVTSLSWIAATVASIRAAKSGPPLDWRWPVGIGVTVYLMARAALEVAFFASTGSAAVAIAPWIIWIRLASACGMALVIAGLAGAAFIRYTDAVSQG